MRLDQLLSFKCVADQRSYTRAAQKCFLTQPAIYSQIRQLEIECGRRLFWTSGKEVLLTAAGRDFYSFAEAVETAYLKYKARTDHRTEQRAKSVRIGARALYGIPHEAAQILCAQDPSFSVDIHSCPLDKAIELVRSEEIDFGFTGRVSAAEGLVFEQVGSYEVIAVAPPGHPLTRREIAFDELSDFPVVGFSAGSVPLALERWLARGHYHQLSYVALADNSVAVKALAMALRLPAIMIRQAVTEEIAQGGLEEVRIRDFAVSYPVFLIYLDERQLGPAATRFLNVVREMFGRDQLGNL